MNDWNEIFRFSPKSNGNGGGSENRDGAMFDRRESPSPPRFGLQLSYSSTVSVISCASIFRHLRRYKSNQMSSILHSMINNYDTVLLSTKDPEVDSWMFMSSPFPVLSILAAYLYFVLKLGPQLMSGRKPYNIQKFLVSYNLYQVIFSMWLCSVPIRLGALHYLIASACQRNLTNQSYYAKELSTGAWWYFISKVVDLLDTVFFVLRKKQEQVTFLHVYHHTITCLFSWGYLKYLPGEQGVVIAFLNSGVHVFMYTYYMIAAMGPKYAKYLWWKKYLTWIQLVQFCLMLTYLLSLLALDCQFPKALTFFFVGNVVIFLFLFARFYKQAYVKKST